MNRNAPGTKKPAGRALLPLICIAAALVFAAGGFIVYRIAHRNGAGSATEAAEEYTRAAMLYDSEGIAKFSSEYNSIIMYPSGGGDPEKLAGYLAKLYSNAATSSIYSDGSFSLESAACSYYRDGDAEFGDITAKYAQKADAGGITDAARVRLRITAGGKSDERNITVVKYGGRWYYAFSG